MDGLSWRSPPRGVFGGSGSVSASGICVLPLRVRRARREGIKGTRSLIKIIKVMSPLFRRTPSQFQQPRASMGILPMISATARRPVRPKVKGPEAPPGD